MTTIDLKTEYALIVDMQSPSVIPSGLHSYEIDAICDQDANFVLERIREVLKTVVLQEPSEWPTDDQWQSLLPEWFVEACVDEPTMEESQAWLDEWRKLPPTEQVEAIENVRWSVGQFVHWFQPSERQWWWWTAEILDSNRFRITLLAEELSPAHEALIWLIRAVGASRILSH